VAWESVVETDLSSPLLGLRVFPAVLDELAGLPATVRDTLLRCICHYCWRHPRRVWRSPVFQGLWITSAPWTGSTTAWSIKSMDQRRDYDADGPAPGRAWNSARRGLSPTRCNSPIGRGGQTRDAGTGQHAANCGLGGGEAAAGGNVYFPWKESSCRYTFCGQALPDLAVSEAQLGFGQVFPTICCIMDIRTRRAGIRPGSSPMGRFRWSRRTIVFHYAKQS